MGDQCARSAVKIMGARICKCPSTSAGQSRAYASQVPPMFQHRVCTGCTRLVQCSIHCFVGRIRRGWFATREYIANVTVIRSCFVVFHDPSKRKRLMMPPKPPPLPSSFCHMHLLATNCCIYCSGFFLVFDGQPHGQRSSLCRRPHLFSSLLSCPQYRSIFSVKEPTSFLLGML